MQLANRMRASKCVSLDSLATGVLVFATSAWTKAAAEGQLGAGMSIKNGHGQPKAINRIPLVPNGRIMAPQSPRYTSFARLQKAKNLDEVF